MLIPVHCQFCGKITAYVESIAVLHVNSPAVKQAKGTLWTIQATCPKCDDSQPEAVKQAKGTLWTIQATCPKCDDSQPEEVQSHPFGDIDELLNIFRIKK